MKEVYREAFAEVDAIFELMPVNLLKKIPEKFREIIKSEKSINYKPMIREPIEEFELKEETIIILALIYRDFLCSKEEKEKLKLRDAQKLKDAEDEIRKKYNPDYIFKNRNNHKVDKKEDIVTEISIAVVEEKWYEKLFDIVKRIFKR